MAANDITKVFDFQLPRSTDVTPPEPAARREPSDYQKALSRSVSSSEKRRTGEPRRTPERSREPSPHQHDTEPLRPESRSNPSEPAHSTEDTEKDGTATPVNGQPDRSAENAQPANAAVEHSVKETPSVPSDAAAETATTLDQEATRQPEITISDSVESLVPPPSLRALFPKVDAGTKAGENFQTAKSGDDNLHPPQGLALSLSGIPNGIDQAVAKANGAGSNGGQSVPWNDALWTKPLTTGDSASFGENVSSAEIAPAVGSDQQIAVDIDQSSSAALAGPDGTEFAVAQNSDSALVQSSADPADNHDDNANPGTANRFAVKSDGENTGQQVFDGEAAVAGTEPVARGGQPIRTKTDSRDEKRVSKTDPYDRTPSTSSNLAAAIAVPGSGQVAVSNGGVETQRQSDVLAAVTSTSTAGPAVSHHGAEERQAGVTSVSNDGVVNAGVKTVAAESRAVVTGSARTGAGQPTTERAEFADRVISAVRSAAELNRPFRVHLNPPELGSLQVEITQRDGIYTARLEVQTASAQQTLLDHIDQLKESLQQNGIRLDRVDVHLNPAGPDDRTPDGSDSRQQQEEPRQDNSDRRQGDDRRGSNGRESNDGSFAESERKAVTANDLVDVQI